MFGNRADFQADSYTGSLDEVKANITKYGRSNRCRFVPGWFEETMPCYEESIAADVDLASSTRTCLRYVYPNIVEGGLLASQDGHLSLVVNELREWQEKNDAEFHGLGRTKSKNARATRVRGSNERSEKAAA